MAETVWARVSRRSTSRPVSRVLYGGQGHRGISARVAAIHLGRRLPGASGSQPGRPPEDRGGFPRRPYSTLLPVGFAVPLPLPVARWALTPPFHPGSCMHEWSDFCGTFPGVAPAGRYPAPCLRGARTFLDTEMPRPPGRLVGEEWAFEGAASRAARGVSLRRCGARDLRGGPPDEPEGCPKAQVPLWRPATNRARSNRRGQGFGQGFWGCFRTSRFPRRLGALFRAGGRRVRENDAPLRLAPAEPMSPRALRRLPPHLF